MIKIAAIDSKEHKDKLQDPNSIESLLKEAKESRNTIIHYLINNPAQTPNELLELCKTLENILKAAAVLYNKDQTALKNSIFELRKNFVSNSKKTFDTVWVKKFILQKIEEEAIDELKTKWDKNNSQLTVPLNHGQAFDRKKVFTPLRMTIPDDCDPNSHLDITVQKLINDCPKQIKLIKGSAGAGKTTQFKFLMDEYLENAKGLQIDAIIYVSCRTAVEDTLVGLLKANMSSTLSFLDDGDISDAASQMVITFLVDGYDEANAKSRKLLFEIIDRSRSCPDKWTFFISSRDHACGELGDELRRRGFNSFITVTLQRISSVTEKKNFLQKFFKERQKCLKKASPQVSEEILDTLPSEVVDILNTPVLLCLFYSFSLRKSIDISTLKDEGSFFSTWFEEIKKDMKRKISDSNPLDKNPGHTAGQVMNMLSELCLKLFAEEKYFLTKHHYEKFTKILIKNTHNEIEVNSVLSCILTPEEDSYSFWHNSLVEYLSANWIVQQLEERQSSVISRMANLTWMFADILAHEGTSRDMWHSNMLQYVSVEGVARCLEERRLEANPFFKIIKKTVGGNIAQMQKR